MQCGHNIQATTKDLSRGAGSLLLVFNMNEMCIEIQLPQDERHNSSGWALPGF